MKVYLFISKAKKLLKMYEPYTEAMSQKLDITDKLTDADVVLILGAWTMLGAQLARKSRKMGIPYIVCPLGDVSDRTPQKSVKGFQQPVKLHFSILPGLAPVLSLISSARTASASGRNARATADGTKTR